MKEGVEVKVRDAAYWESVMEEFSGIKVFIKNLEKERREKRDETMGKRSGNEAVT